VTCGAAVRPSIKQMPNLAILICGPLEDFRRFFVMLLKVKRFLFSQLFLNMSEAKKAAYLGVFMALAIVANVYSIDVSPQLKISFNYLVGFFAGTFFGPLGGFLILFLGDFLAFLLSSGGGYYWLLTGIATGLLAFIPGVVMNTVRLPFRGGAYVKAAISVVLMYLLVTCGFGAMSNYLYIKIYLYHGDYQKTFWLYLSGKILFSTVVSAVNYVLVFLLIPVFNAVKPLKIKIE
jgi:hypothetical protein